MEKRQRFFCAMSALVIIAGLFPSATGAIPILDFDIGTPTTGSIGYNGGEVPLAGRGISVDSVIGLGTPNNDGKKIIFGSDENPGAYLNFNTGILTSYSGDVWHFGSGGERSIVIRDIVHDTDLLVGTITSATVESIEGLAFKVTIASFIDTKDPELLEFYGLPTGNYEGGLNLQFSLTYFDPSSGAFYSNRILSGDVTNTPVPEPTTMMLLGSGLLGLVGIRKKLLKK